jgi:hypothetical protein
MPGWRKLITLAVYCSMIGVGIVMVASWLMGGARGIIFAAGGFLAAFGAYLLWNDFLSPKRERL